MAAGGFLMEVILPITLFFHLIINQHGLLRIQAHFICQLKTIFALRERVVIDRGSMIVSFSTAREQIIRRRKAPTIIVNEGKVTRVIIAITNNHIETHK